MEREIGHVGLLTYTVLLPVFRVPGGARSFPAWLCLCKKVTALFGNLHMPRDGTLLEATEAYLPGANLPFSYPLLGTYARFAFLLRGDRIPIVRLEPLSSSY